MAITRRLFCLCLACAPAGRLGAQDAPSPATQPARELHGLVEPSLHVAKAGSGLPPRSARGRPGDDITGDKAVRELIAKTKGHYY